MPRGGIPGKAGRKPFRDPETAAEAARMLATYTDGGVWPTTTGDVALDVRAAVALLHKLRRRKPKGTP